MGSQAQTPLQYIPLPDQIVPDASVPSDPNAQFNAITAMLKELKADNIQLQTEITLLRAAANRSFPSTTQELLDYTANEFQGVLDRKITFNQHYVNTWKSAASFFRLTGNLRESIAKGAAGETPDAKAVEFAPFLDAITKALKPGKGNKIDKDKHCEKCGRDGHVKAKCYAKTHSDGSKLS